MRAILGLGPTVCLLVLGYGAQQAHATAVPTRPVALSGLTVAWPASSSITIAPNSRLRIAVRPTAKAARTARAQFTFVRVSADGRALRVIARRTLRSGTFTAAVTASRSARYRLAVSSGRVRRTVSVAIEPLPAAAPSGPCGWSPPSDGGAASATLHVEPATIAAGQALSVTVENTGDICLGYGLGSLTWERGEAGSWTPIPDDRPYPSIAMLLAPHHARVLGSGAVTAPVPLTTGHYRLTFSAVLAPDGVQTRTPVTAAAELDVS